MSIVWSTQISFSNLNKGINIYRPKIRLTGIMFHFHYDTTVLCLNLAWHAIVSNVSSQPQLIRWWVEMDSSSHWRYNFPSLWGNLFRNWSFLHYFRLKTDLHFYSDQTVTYFYMELQLQLGLEVSYEHYLLALLTCYWWDLPDQMTMFLFS